MRALRVALGVVDGRVGRAVDHHIAGCDELLGRDGVGDVPLRGGQGQHVKAPPAGRFRQNSPDLPARAGDHDPIGHHAESGTPGSGYRLCAPNASNLG